MSGFPVFQAVASSLPRSLLGLTRRGDYRAPENSTYKRFTRCRHPTDPTAPVLEVFHTPSEFPRPQCRVVFRAPKGGLLDLVAVDAIACTLLDIWGPALSAFRSLSEVELAIDLPDDSLTTRHVQQSLYVPRSRHVVSNDEWEWGHWGSRRSGTGVRVYAKREGRLNATRIELILRRGRLKKLGIGTVAALCDVDWLALVSRTLRVVEFRESRTRGKRIPWAFEAVIAGRGVTGGLRHLAKRDRAWLRRRLKPGPLNAAVLAAVAAFHSTLPATREEIEARRRGRA